jgi:hypothetical protein
VVEPQTPDEHAELRRLYAKRRRAWAKMIGRPLPKLKDERMKPPPLIIDHDYEPEG